MKFKKFEQMALLGYQLLHYVDQGKFVSIGEVCQRIEDGDVVEFIFKRLGMDNTNFSSDDIADVNIVLKEKDISETVAKDLGIEKNGLAYLVRLILEDATNLLYDIDMDDDNDIQVESYRH